MKKRMGRRGQINPVDSAANVENAVQEATEQVEQKVEQKTGLNKKLIIYIGIGVGALLALGIILAFVFLGGDESSDSTGDSGEQVSDGGNALGQDTGAGTGGLGSGAGIGNQSGNVSECTLQSDCVTLYGVGYVCMAGQCSYGILNETDNETSSGANTSTNNTGFFQNFSAAP